MGMDTRHLPYSKGRPAKLAREDRRRARQSADLIENEKVKARSGGRCEVTVNRLDRLGLWSGASRCTRRAIHIHHLLSGIGVRAHGRSLLADHKLDVCLRCHSDIHGHVLNRIGDPLPLWTDCYERVRLMDICLYVAAGLCGLLALVAAVKLGREMRELLREDWTREGGLRR